jgi:hypothetical protein
LAEAPLLLWPWLSSPRVVAALFAPHGEPVFPIQPIDPLMVHSPSFSLLQRR